MKVNAKQYCNGGCTCDRTCGRTLLHLVHEYTTVQRGNAAPDNPADVFSDSGADPFTSLQRYADFCPRYIILGN